MTPTGSPARQEADHRQQKQLATRLWAIMRADRGFPVLLLLYFGFSVTVFLRSFPGHFEVAVLPASGLIRSYVSAPKG